MKIFRVRADVNRFQRLVFANNEDVRRSFFDGRPVENWSPVEARIFNPLLERGNFLGLVSGSLVFDQVAYDRVGDLLEAAGQVLPVWQGKEQLFLLNVTACADALNADASGWRLDPKTRERVSLAQYAFFPDRIGESSLFKIPETIRAEVLGYTGVKAANDEFWRRYTSSGLKGLIAEELFHT